MYDKRIAFMISKHHYTASGGIGQFCKGFVEMAERLNWVVDIIIDSAPTNSAYSDYMAEISGKIIWPDKPISYSDHRKTFSFKESANLEKMVNFRDALMKAFSENMYDMVVVNVLEALNPTYILGIEHHVPIVLYTHAENLVFSEKDTFKGPFSEAHDNFFLHNMYLPNVYVGTQTQRNVDELSKHYSGGHVLPMPVPERGLLQHRDVEKSGVLFIGRWDERKNPTEFVRVIKETGLHAKVMTNARGATRFKKELDAVGASYDIRHNITGDEKVDFIQGSKIHYNPSKSENYAFAFYEAVGHTHAFVLDEYEWYTNFDPKLYHVCSKKDVASAILSYYNQDVPVGKLDEIKRLDADIECRWSKFMAEFKPKYSTSNASNISKQNNFYYEDYIIDLKREPSIEDAITALANRDKFQIIYTKDGTWFTKDGSSPAKRITEQANLDNLFL